MKLDYKEILQKFRLIKQLNKKYILIFLLLVLCAMLFIVLMRSVPKEITLNEYENFLDGNLIKKAILDENKVIINVKGYRYYVLKDSIDLNELAQKVAIGVKKEMGFDMGLIIGAALVFGIYAFFARRRRLSTQASAELSAMVEGQTIMPTISKVAFKDVAGIDDVKTELIEIVDFLKNPKIYKDFGVKLPKGVLMIGPPGVGKTLVAKAVAGEANVPFFYQSGASFVQIYVGMGAKRVRELFAKAKSYAPSIIFIDEIDAVGKARGGGRNDEREATLNQLLTEMDGFHDNSGVIVIAATNKIEMIDDALLRSGRFDRRIYLTLPDLHDRKDILKAHLSNKKHEVNIEAVARHTTGFSGAALATLVNEAAINALKNKRMQILNDDIKAVFDKVLHGKRKIYSLTRDEKEVQALYKAAKAIAAEWFGIEFERISLLEDRFLLSDRPLTSKSEMLAKIKVLLAGRVAMKLYQKELYSNCASDIEQARELAKIIVVDYAMNDDLLANTNDIAEILNNANAEVMEFMTRMKNQLFALRDYLFLHESVTRAIVADFARVDYE